MADDMPTPELVQQANQMLTFLTEKSKKNVKKVMQDSLTEKEYELNLRNMEAKLAEFEIEEPFGAVEGGTGVAKEEAGLEGEEGQRAIQLLKEHGRLQQCGRGRGKCLIILRSDPLEQMTPPHQAAGVQLDAPAPVDEGGGAEEGPPMVDATSITALTRAIRDLYRDRDKQLGTAQREVKALEKKVDEMTTELQSKDEELANLHNQMEHAQVATWQ